MNRMKLTAAACAAAMMMTSITGYAATGVNAYFAEPGSQAISVRADLPTPVISIEKLADDSVRLSWETAGDSDTYSYQYDLAMDAAFTSIQTSNENYSLCTFKMSDLEQNTPYFFRVRAFKDNMYSDYAKTLVLMPNPTAPLSLQSPALRTEPYLVDDNGNEVSNSVKLMWDAIPYATGYQYQFAYDPGFNAIIKEHDTQKIELKLVRLAPGTHYYVRVRAICEINGQTIFSAYGLTEVLIPEETAPTETTEPPTTEAPTETTTEATEPPTTEAPTETTTEATEPPTTEAPTETTTVPTETTEPSGDKPLTCDVNSDGQINAIDATDLLVALAKIGAGEDSGLNDTQKKAADADNSGDLNAGDASVILMYAAYLGAGGQESFWDYGSAQGWILPG